MLEVEERAAKSNEVDRLLQGRRIQVIAKPTDQGFGCVHSSESAGHSAASKRLSASADARAQELRSKQQFTASTVGQRLAQNFWEEEGQPEGKADEHWLRAEDELRGV